MAYLKSKAPWVKGVFVNVRDFPPSDWNLVRQRCAEHGLFCGPWGRTARLDANGKQIEPAEFDPNVLDMLIKTADAWHTPLIVNSESELKGSGADLTHYIAAETGSRQAAISMERWPFANVDWVPVAHLPVLPQIFDYEFVVQTAAECKAEWHRVGVRCVYLTFGVYGGATPAAYDLKAPYSLYPGDGLMASYSLETWAPTSDGFKGCVEVAPPAAPPTTAETRRAIAAAAADWEEGQTAATPLTRITVARRIVESTNSQWTSVNDQIAKLLDDVGVVA